MRANNGIIKVISCRCCSFLNSDEFGDAYMKIKLYELDGYLIDNPLYKKEPHKYKYMRKANVLYRSVRSKLTPIFPLKECEKVYFDEEMDL